MTVDASPLADGSAEPACERPRGLRRRRVAAQLGAGMTELGWAVCESLFMPLLLGRDVPAVLLASCWLFSPLFGFVLHPCIGTLSDRHGRRPFVLGLGFVAAGGLVAIPRCAKLPGTTGVVAAIVAFGVTDTCHDLLLTPTRAAMNDVFAPDAAARYSAVAAAVGKLIGLLCATFLKGDAPFYVVAGIIGAAASSQFVVPCERADAEEHDNEPCCPRFPSTAPTGFWILWCLSFCGWLSQCIFFFYFTSVWTEILGYGPPGSSGFDDGVKVATALLMAHTVGYIIAGFLVPRAVKLFGGEMNAMTLSVIVFVVQFGSFIILPSYFSFGWAVLVLPMALQTNANAPFAWLERQAGFDERERGRLTGWLNLTVSFAQIVTSLATGPVVAFFHGRLLAAFGFAGCLDAVVFLCVLARLCCIARSSRSPPLIDEQSLQPSAGLS